MIQKVATTIANASGHWRTVHARSATPPSCSAPAICGPAISTALPARKRTPQVSITPRETIRCFHQGRLSSTPYASFSVLVSAMKTLDEAQSASTRPIENGPGAFSCTT